VIYYKYIYIERETETEKEREGDENSIMNSPQNTVKKKGRGEKEYERII
jgi:hypothetical protein